MPLANINLSSVGDESDAALVERLRHVYSQSPGVTVEMHETRPLALVLRGSELVATVRLTFMDVAAHIIELI